MKFMLVNTDFHDCEIFTIGGFKTPGEAFKYASELADKMGYGIEVYELKRVVHPSFTPSADEQISCAWGQALIDTGMAGLDKAAAAEIDAQRRMEENESKN